MRGKIKASTRFQKFREVMLLKFNEDPAISSEFMSFIRSADNSLIVQLLLAYCDESESLLHLESGSPQAVYQMIRLVNRPILLRDLEVLGELTWGSREGKRNVFEAISLLYSTNLVDYSFRDFNSTPSNILQFFVKEED